MRFSLSSPDGAATSWNRAGNRGRSSGLRRVVLGRQGVTASCIRSIQADHGPRWAITQAGGAAIVAITAGPWRLLLQARPGLFARVALRLEPTSRQPLRLRDSRFSKGSPVHGSGAWRREGLSIAARRRNGAREHRLRRLINGRLGHRNFAISSTATASRRRSDGSPIQPLATRRWRDRLRRRLWIRRAVQSRVPRCNRSERPTNGVDRPCTLARSRKSRLTFKLGDDLSDPARQQNTRGGSSRKRGTLNAQCPDRTRHIWWLNISILLPVYGSPPQGLVLAVGFCCGGRCRRRKIRKEPRAEPAGAGASLLASIGWGCSPRQASGQRSSPRRYFPLADLARGGGRYGLGQPRPDDPGAGCLHHWGHRWMHRRAGSRTSIVATDRVTTPRRFAAYSFDVGEAVSDAGFPIRLAMDRAHAVVGVPAVLVHQILETPCSTPAMS